MTKRIKEVTSENVIKLRQMRRLKREVDIVSFFTLMIMVLNFSLSILFYNLSGETLVPVISLLSLMMITLFSVFLPTIFITRFFGLKKRCEEEAEKPEICTFYIAFGYGFCITVNYIIEFLSEFFPHLGSSGIVEIYGTDWYILLLITLAVCIVPALCEELAFRGYIMDHLKNFGDGTAIVFSAFVFGILHPGNAEMFFAFCSGIIFGLIKRKTKSIVPGMIVHFLNNFTASIAAVSAAFLPHRTYDILYHFVSIMSFALMLIALLLINKLKMKVLYIESNGCILSIPEKLRVVFFNSPIFWIFIICAFILKFI